MSSCVRLITLFGLLLLASASHAQVYARFGSKLEKEFDKRIHAVADISPDLPACKRNDAAWWAQVQRFDKMWNDPRRLSDVSWRVERWNDTLPHVEDWPLRLRVPPTQTKKGAVPEFGPAQGVTWLDIDGDGWCDALLSVDAEAVKRPGLPIILTGLSAALFYDPASQAFKQGSRGPYLFNSRGGEITSAFSFYYNRKARRVETVERLFSSGMRYSSGAWEELHGQLMLKGKLLMRPLCEQAGSESEPCGAYTVMNEEFERVLDALSEQDPREAAIRKRLMNLAESPAKAP